MMKELASCAAGMFETVGPERRGPVQFSKMSGHGNDFVIIDNREGLSVRDWPAFAEHLCDRRRSVGADGVLLIESSNQADFKLRIYNADGSEADMCGNGARCAALYALRKKIVAPSMIMETGAGAIKATVDGDHASIKLAAVVEVTPPSILSLEGTEAVRVYAIDSGVPHAVVFTGNSPDGIAFGSSLKEVPRSVIHQLGKELRYHSRWGDQGSNVDFVEIIDRHRILVRTYERGVEGETLACGTGAVASAFAARQTGAVTGETVAVDMPGGELSVCFQEGSDRRFEAWLAGKVVYAFEGVLALEEE